MASTTPVPVYTLLEEIADGFTALGLGWGDRVDLNIAQVPGADCTVISPLSGSAHPDVRAYFWQTTQIAIYHHDQATALTRAQQTQDTFLSAFAGMDGTRPQWLLPHFRATKVDISPYDYTGTFGEGQTAQNAPARQLHKYRLTLRALWVRTS